MNEKYLKMSPKNYLKELQKFRERVRTEILGEQNAEYRDQLKELLKATDRKIKEVSVKVKNARKVLTNEED